MPRWRRTRFGVICSDLLFQLRQLQMICCPDSGSHVEESRTSPFNAELKKTYEALSSGITFSGIRLDKVRIRSANSRLRGRKAENRRSISTLGTSCPVTRMSGTNIFTSSWGTTRSSRRRGCDKYALNSTPTLTRLFRDVWGKEKRNFEFWYELERKDYQNALDEGGGKAQARA